MKGMFVKGHKHTKEALKKISAAGKGRKHSAKWYQVMTSKRGEKACHWKGGRTVSFRGYVFIKAYDHPFRNNKNYVNEHRLVVEKQIGRYLNPFEKVHHINKNLLDNRPENLMAFSSNSSHMKYELKKNKIKSSEIIFDGSLLPS